MRSLRLNEATMTRTNAELSHRAQQLDTRLNVLEAELSKAKEEVLWRDIIDPVEFWMHETLFPP